MDNKYSILVLSHDKNADLWDNFFELLRSNWCDMKSEVFLTTNILSYKKYEVKSVITKLNTTPYDRLMAAIEIIKDDYLIMFNDDFYILSSVDNTLISECVQFCINNKCDFYSLSKGRKTKEGKFKGVENRYIIGNSEEYAINFGIVIWKKSFLVKILEFCEGNPWKIEENFKFLNKEKTIQLGNPLLIQDKRKLIDYSPLVAKGLYVRSEYFRCINKGIKLDISLRQIQSMSSYIKRMIMLKGKKIIPKNCRKWIKKLFAKMGFEFVSNN